MTRHFTFICLMFVTTPSAVVSHHVTYVRTSSTMRLNQATHSATQTFDPPCGLTRDANVNAESPERSAAVQISRRTEWMRDWWTRRLAPGCQRHRVEYKEEKGRVSHPHCLTAISRTHPDTLTSHQPRDSTKWRRDLHLGASGTA